MIGLSFLQQELFILTGNKVKRNINSIRVSNLDINTLLARAIQLLPFPFGFIFPFAFTN
jgi:hypothetical protein